eukprot:gene14694-17371_t
MKETVVSGIRPTGKLHLGNYFGAVTNFVKMQYDYNCYFFIADLHSLTTHPTPQDLHGYSDVPEVAELYLYLNMNAYMGELERSTSFKDKIRSQPDNVNAGLLTYPTLMAADILIHKATKVPVGKDQEQHLEMTRTFGNRFNRLYNAEYFPEAYAFNYSENLVKVPGLDGKGKMSKSNGEGSCIYLSDSPEIIRKKLSRAVTDGGPTQEHQQKPEAIQNLFDLMKIVSSPDTLAHFDELYNNMAIRYGDFKKQLAEDMILANAPIRERIEELSKDTLYLRQVAKHGALKARESAQKTIKEVRQLIGFKPF